MKGISAAFITENVLIEGMKRTAADTQCRSF